MQRLGGGTEGGGLLALTSTWEAQRLRLLHSVASFRGSILQLDADKYENDPELEKIRKERNYSWMDIITISKEKLPDYEEKVRRRLLGERVIRFAPIQSFLKFLAYIFFFSVSIWMLYQSNAYLNFLLRY